MYQSLPLFAAAFLSASFSTDLKGDESIDGKHGLQCWRGNLKFISSFYLFVYIGLHFYVEFYSRLIHGSSTFVPPVTKKTTIILLHPVISVT